MAVFGWRDVLQAVFPLCAAVGESLGKVQGSMISVLSLPYDLVRFVKDVFGPALDLHANEACTYVAVFASFFSSHLLCRLR